MSDMAKLAIEAYERGGYTVIRLIRSGLNIGLPIEKILEVAEASLNDTIQRKKVD